MIAARRRSCALWRFLESLRMSDLDLTREKDMGREVDL